MVPSFTHIPLSTDDNLVFATIKHYFLKYPSAMVKLPLVEGMYVIAIYVEIV